MRAVLVSRSIVLPQNIAPLKLPVWRTVGACYAFVGGNLMQLLRISWLPLLAMLPVFVLANWLASPSQAPAGQNQSGPAGEIAAFLAGATQLPFLASIAVAWHRLVLREERIVDWRYLRLDSVVWQYAGVCLVLNLLLLVPSLNAAMRGDPRLAGPAALAGFAILFFVLPRASLMLPAIALYRDLSPTEAWRASRANTWRLALASMLCLLPPLFLVGLAIMYAERSFGVPKLIATPVASAVVTLAMTVSITLLSLAFDLFIRQRDPRKFKPA
jgi:hypothetical protein